MKNMIIDNLIDEAIPASEFTSDEEATLKLMMEAGLFYGLSRSKANPKMKPYISSAKSGIQIINLVKTLKSIKSAASILKEKVKAGGLPMVVGATPAVKTAVRNLGVRFNIPYVTERWLGGTLTNFKTISARVQYLKKIRSDRETGKLEKYTKKEKLDIEREMNKLERLFSGLETMDKLPEIIVIFDLKSHDLAAREALRMNITSIAIANTNADPDDVDYPIIGNDRNPKSIEFIASYFAQAIEDGRKEAAEISKINSVHSINSEQIDSPPETGLKEVNVQN